MFKCLVVGLLFVIASFATLMFLFLFVIPVGSP